MKNKRKEATTMSNEWKMVRLGDCATFINGKAFKPSDWVDDGVPIVRIQNLTGSSNDVNYFNGAIEDKYRIINGDILISWSASLGVFVWNRGSAVLNQHIFKVQFNKLPFNMGYFYYMMQDAIGTMSTHVHGATMKHITKSKFDNISVLYPSIERQREIAGVLDKASELVSKRKAQLDELDRLAESIFYDMFGDPVTNEKGWETNCLKQLTTKIGSGATPRGGNESYKDEGISLIRSLNVHNGMFKYKDLAYIDDAQAAALNNVTIESDDILLNITGASVARCCIVPSEILPARVNQHVAIVRLIKERVDFRFLCSQLISVQYQRKLLNIGKSNGATREALTKANVEDLNVILPPLPLQQQFAQRIEKIEEQKKKVKAALKESEELFWRLMQDMFNPDNKNS